MYTKDEKLYVAHSDKPIYMTGKMANRHGLIACATGTGKTVSLQVLAETFSQAGVPCFMADMKGDLSGISQPGSMNKFIEVFGVALQGLILAFRIGVRHALIAADVHEHL